MIVNRVGLAIDGETNDLFLDASNNLVLSHDAKAVAEHTRQRLMHFQGEWFLDTTAGVPWLERLLGRQPDLPLAEAVLKAEILNTDGVTGISAFSARFIAGTRRVDVPKVTVITEYETEASL